MGMRIRAGSLISCMPRCALDGGRIADIGNGDPQTSRFPSRLLELLEIMLNTFAREIVEYVHASARFEQQMSCQVRADKAGSAEDQRRPDFFSIRHLSQCSQIQ